jgi:hypothetical protein
MEITKTEKITVRNNEEYRKQYYSNYHKTSISIDCPVCFKKYKKSKGYEKHKQTKRHQEFEKLNLNIKIL